MNIVPLGELVDIKGGGTPSKDVSCYWGGNIPWASVKDFKTTIIDRTTDMITDIGVEKSATNIIKAGAVIVPTRMAVGKAAINTIDIAINQDLKALIPKQNLSNRFLLHYILANSNFLESQASGATVKGIKLDVLRELIVPLPPLPEQKRIADILDKADNLRKLRRTAIEKLNSLSQSIFYEMFGDRQHTIKLGDICAKVDKWNQKDKFGSEFINYIDIASVNQKAKKIEDAKHISVDEPPSRAKQIVKRGDVLVSTVRPNLNSVAVVKDNLNNAIASTGFCVLRPKNDIYTQFIFSIVRSEKFISSMSELATGASYPAISDKIAKDYLIPKISEAEARLYSHKINSIENVINNNIKQQEELDTLFLSLQQRAFKGEL